MHIHWLQIAAEGVIWLRRPKPSSRAEKQSQDADEQHNASTVDGRRIAASLAGTYRVGCPTRCVMGATVHERGEPSPSGAPLRLEGQADWAPGRRICTGYDAY